MLSSGADPSQPKLSLGFAPDDAFDHMDTGQIAAWLEDGFLTDKRPKNAAEAAVGPPRVWVKSAFPGFCDAVKERFAAALLSLWDDVSAHPDKWNPEALMRMAFFTEGVLLSDARTQAQEKFLSLLKNNAFSPQQKKAFLMGLLTTHYHAAQNEWDVLLERCEGQSHATKIVFSIAARHDLAAAVDWLAKQPPGEHITETLLDITPWLIHLHGLNAVKAAYGTYHAFDALAVRAFRDYRGAKGGAARA